ncbi:hypothetical protein ACIQTW_21380 [Paenarthrobacter sp. NPDC090517]|uniref:hypothetical protein n=1 Tax=Paenarthrobacter sp. NPDC090517 TaxID=3364381 RepID=UPI0037F7EC5A
MSESTDPTPKAENPFTKPWFLASGAVIVVIIVLAVVYTLLPPVGAAPNAQPTPTTDKSSAAPAAAPGDSVCGLPKGDQTIPGPGLVSKWELNGKTAVPVDSSKFGPGKSVDGVRTCFAHNPTGALYAAANFVSYGTEGKPDVLFKHLAADGPARDRYLSNPPTFSPRDDSLSMQIAAFRVVSYTDDLAVLEIGVASSNGVKLSAPYTLSWEKGDWKVVVTETQPTQVDSFTNMVTWAGA